jgi:dihydropteroate synthase
MGIVNRTPDSFYDGGAYLDDRAAEARVLSLRAEGADLVDLGAESTRPGAPRVEACAQIERLGGLLAFAVAHGVVVSVDTTEPAVAEWALRGGASMINSVSLDTAAELGALASRFGAELVLTHCRGSMTQMAGFSAYADDAYDDVVREVADEWRQAAARALGHGLAARALYLDPGLGFTKNAAQSLELCARIAELHALGHPILVGTSRKSFIAQAAATELGGAPPAPAERLGGSIAAVLWCATAGVSIVRVHDVAATRQALALGRALSTAFAPAHGRGPTATLGSC